MPTPAWRIIAANVVIKATAKGSFTYSGMMLLLVSLLVAPAACAAAELIGATSSSLLPFSPCNSRDSLRKKKKQLK